MAPNIEVFKLSPEIVGRAELIRMQRELGDLEDKVSEVSAKKTHEKIPISTLLHKLANDNKIDLNKEQDRIKLKNKIKTVMQDAPSMQISFATSPTHDFVTTVTKWFRQEIHPQALINVGLQPTIAAGCVLRTTNKVFDLSLKKNMLKKQELLVSNLRGNYGQ